MIVQHNMNAINAYNRLNANVAGLKKASEKLASGYRINRAGDDAAGLAISEKMRSQIKGLNQAVRNSQDGINMIQTYEGAAQETHSILQRMKELATQSANGTYDNATDRAAIQLEFDQLNDELNQIADTDFNGTVVLNGGVMADGTVAKNGEFRYAEGYTETVVANKATDISGEQEHTMVDQSKYTKEIADAVYKAVQVDVADVADATKTAAINVTFMYDGERWVADTVTDSKGNVVDGARASGLEARTVERNNASGIGGFQVIAGKNPYTSEDIVATNVIFDEMTGPVKKGDTVTVKFENSVAKTYAPKNAGLDEDYAGTKQAFKISGTDATLTTDDLKGKISFKLSSSITDEAMTADLAGALEAIDGAKFKATYKDGTATLAFDEAIATTITEDNGFSKEAEDAAKLITIEGNDLVYDKDGKNITLGTITTAKMTVKQPAEDPKVGAPTLTATTAADYGKLTTTDDTVTNVETLLGANKPAADGDVVGILAKSNGTIWKIYLTDKDGNLAQDEEGNALAPLKTGIDDADIFTTLGIEADGTDFALNGATANDSIAILYTPKKNANDNAGDTTKNGDVTFGLNIDAFNFASMTDLSVHAVETPTVATMASQVAAGNVSVADSFSNSTGVLTYAENLTLQTGARTKDSVNFNFSYNTDGTADMGSLVPNLDLSSRSTGLNTANLSLANQKDANYAIDQIDKAINKTSMVRATFGSIQNRLEHKITNLTTTAENLTEAESSIRDTDMASEMMNYTKFNILQQAAQSMLAQANQQPQSILQLLG